MGYIGIGGTLYFYRQVFGFVELIATDGDGVPGESGGTALGSGGRAHNIEICAFVFFALYAEELLQPFEIIHVAKVRASASREEKSHAEAQSRFPGEYLSSQRCCV